MATKGVKLKDSNNNVILPVTSSDLVEVNYGGTSKILTDLLEENESVTAEALVDLNSRLSNVPTTVSVSGNTAAITDNTIFVPYAEISYNLQQTNTSLRGGAIIGSISYNHNRGSSNVVTSPINDNYGTDGTEGTNTASGLRYETPLLNVCCPKVTGGTGNAIFKTGTLPPPSASTMHKNYYDPLNSATKKINITTSTNALSSYTYAPLIIGNNYCNVATAEKEMYFFDGNKMMNYFTVNARIDMGSSDLKEVKENTILQWGSYTSTANVGTTLLLQRDKITFEKRFKTSTTPPAADATTIFPRYINTGTLSAYLMGAGNTWTTSTRSEIGGNYIKLIYYNNNKVNLTTTSATFSIPAYATKFYETSDERVKNNINQITYIPNDINIYSFVKNDYNTYSYGFIAQNVANTHPELVSYNESYLSVDYNSTLSLLLAKALNRIEELEKRIEELENKIK